MPLYTGGYRLAVRVKGRDSRASGLEAVNRTRRCRYYSPIPFWENRSHRSVMSVIRKCDQDSNSQDASWNLFRSSWSSRRGRARAPRPIKNYPYHQGALNTYKKRPSGRCASVSLLTALSKVLRTKCSAETNLCTPERFR